MTKSFSVIHLLAAAPVVFGAVYFAMSRSWKAPGGVATTVGQASIDTSGDHEEDLGHLTERQLKQQGDDLDRIGCKRLRDYRLFITDLRRLPDAVSTNDNGNRVCRWEFDGAIVTIVDDADGLVDNASVILNVSDTKHGALGLALLIGIADAHSKLPVDTEALARWVIQSASKEGASARFGQARLDVVGVSKSDGKHYVAVQVI